VTRAQSAISSVGGASRRPPVWLVALAGLGAMLLVVVAVGRWADPQDEQAYWLAGQRLLAGQPLYDPTATPVTPYVFWYAPPLAQLMAPVSAILPSPVFRWAWTALLLGCLLAVARGRPLVALALVAFLPVALELQFRNVHLLLALILALAVLRWPWLFAVGAAIKVAPGLGIVYLLVQRRWREAAIAAAVGAGILAVSVALSPGAWSDFASVVVGGRASSDTSGLIPVIYPVRAAAGLVLTIVAARLRPAFGEPLLVVAIVLASPTLFPSALSMLIAIPLIVSVRRSEASRAGVSSIGGFGLLGLASSPLGASAGSSGGGSAGSRQP
jgi:hypothetical protein